MQEEQLKERIESLDPLSVGVVFGKEDAWDKLQSRLDVRPKRKILPVYWWAAAVLMLLLGLAFIFRQNERAPQQFVSNTKQPAINSAAPSSAAQAEVTTSIAPETTAPVVAYTTAASSETTITMKTNPLPAGSRKHALPTITTPLIPAAILPATPVPVANIAVPTLVVKQPMKVIHINELGRLNDEPVKPAFADNNPTGIDLSKLPVVHINEVSKSGFKQYYEELEIKNQSSFLTFMKPSNQFGFTTANQPFNGALTRLKIKIN